ncbi:hypothetical protein EZS27_027856 [termite gut metagenome]|uniref:Uncharacterized protein n=1 Tax=termite gut metagenome TaxID=433724 RepID=A0A5J4QNF9_9ZZZZ
MNLQYYELKNKIAQLEIVDKQNCKLKEEYDQGIISDAIQQIGFCYSSLPVGNINTDDIFTKIDIQPIEETIAIIKKLEEHKPL